MFSSEAPAAALPGQEKHDAKTRRDQIALAGLAAAALGGMEVAHQDIPDMAPHAVITGEAPAEATSIPGVTIEHGANFGDPMTVHVELPKEQQTVVAADATEAQQVHVDLNEHPIHTDLNEHPIHVPEIES